MKQITIFESHSDDLRDLEDQVNEHLGRLDELGCDVVDIKMTTVSDRECSLRWFSVMVLFDMQDEED
jgi:hypothetical protein